MFVCVIQRVHHCETGEFVTFFPINRIVVFNSENADRRFFKVEFDDTFCIRIRDESMLFGMNDLTEKIANSCFNFAFDIGQGGCDLKLGIDTLSWFKEVIRCRGEKFAFDRSRFISRGLVSAFKLNGIDMTDRRFVGFCGE